MVRDNYELFPLHNYTTKIVSVYACLQHAKIVCVSFVQNRTPTLMQSIMHFFPSSLHSCKKNLHAAQVFPHKINQN